MLPLRIVMHAFGKVTVFFCAGAVPVAAHKTEIRELASNPPHAPRIRCRTTARHVMY